MARLVGCVMSLSVLMGAHINSAESRVVESRQGGIYCKTTVKIFGNEYHVQRITWPSLSTEQAREYGYCFTREELGIRSSSQNQEDARIFTLNSILQGFLRDVSKSQ